MKMTRLIWKGFVIICNVCNNITRWSFGKCLRNVVSRFFYKTLHIITSVWSQLVRDSTTVFDKGTCTFQQMSSCACACVCMSLCACVCVHERVVSIAKWASYLNCYVTRRQRRLCGISIFFLFSSFVYHLFVSYISYFMFHISSFFFLLSSVYVISSYFIQRWLLRISYYMFCFSFFIFNLSSFVFIFHRFHISCFIFHFRLCLFALV